MLKSLISLLLTHPAWGRHPLAQGARWAVFKRWLGWQFCSRVIGLPVIMPWINDTRLVIGPHEAVTKGNYYLGLLEFPEMGFLLHFLRENEGFADIGANTGAYTVLAAFACAARTIAFEPIPSAYAALQQNIAINHIRKPNTKIEAHQMAVGHDRKNVMMTSNLGTMNQVIQNPSPSQSNAVEVQQTTLDEALTSFPAILWKIDVEGHEDFVIQGAMQRLAEPHLQAVIMEKPSPFIYATMRTYGFEDTSYDPLHRKFIPIANQVTDNVIWIRNRAFCENRVNSARHISWLHTTF